MSRKEKLLKRLLALPKDFTYDELVSLLTMFNFYEAKTGKTSGSAVRFKNDGLPYEPIIFHKPHPQNIIKPYVLKSVIACLTRCNLIESESENGNKTEETDE
ncbi:MAG: type II toxin-antitoxin system HicA family toxin [Bacteroidales bacterium]|jgi:hypothetical protein|nr:type II toxin-antitoxin system HicA family toxin [Bacteroidales bacterium]